MWFYVFTVVVLGLTPLDTKVYTYVTDPEFYTEESCYEAAIVAGENLAPAFNENQIPAILSIQCELIEGIKDV